MMIYVKLEVKTNEGYKIRYFKYTERSAFGKHLCRYYKGKKYSYEEIEQRSADMLMRVYHKKFKEIT